LVSAPAKYATTHNVSGSTVLLVPGEPQQR